MNSQIGFPNFGCAATDSTAPSARHSLAIVLNPCWSPAPSAHILVNRALLGLRSACAIRGRRRFLRLVRGGRLSSVKIYRTVEACHLFAKPRDKDMTAVCPRLARSGLRVSRRPASAGCPRRVASGLHVAALRSRDYNSGLSLADPSCARSKLCMTSKSPPAVSYFSFLLPSLRSRSRSRSSSLTPSPILRSPSPPFMALLFCWPSDSSTPGVSFSWLPAALHLRY